MNAPQANTSNLPNIADKIPTQQNIQQGITNIGNTLQATSNQLSESFNEFSKVCYA